MLVNSGNVPHILQDQPDENSDSGSASSVVAAAPPTPILAAAPPTPILNEAEAEIDDMDIDIIPEVQYPTTILGQKVTVETKWNRLHTVKEKVGLRIKCSNPAHLCMPGGCGRYRNVEDDRVI
jgi:hypothetical protein